MTATLSAPAEPEEAVTGEVAPRRPVPAALQPWHDPNPMVGWLMTLGVAILAAVTRFWALGYPNGKVFDEVYYATEAQEVMRFGYEDNRDYMFIVHPPLGKILIGWGGTAFGWIDAHTFGNHSWGWRVAPAIAGTLLVVMVARTARRMLRSNVLGGVAGVLMALEGLTFVLSRTALLDIFLETFVFASFAALVVDRDRMRARLGGLIADGADLHGAIPRLGPRPWRLLAGVLIGMACAVKWTAAFFFIGFLVLAFFWDHGAFRAAGVRHHWRATWRRMVPPALGTMIVVPIGTYLLCYLGWFTGENSWGRHWADTHSASTHLHVLGLKIPFWWGWVPSPVRSLGAYTLDAYRFHEGLDSFHPYRSNPWSWLVDGRPVDFYYDGSSHACGASTCSREIFALGTPLMWWAFLPMLLWLAWHWVTTRDWRAGSIWLAFLVGWGVWFSDLKRTMFFFYMAPLAPFLVIGLTLALGALLGPAVRRTGDLIRDRRAVTRRTWGVAVVSVYLGLVIADFVWMWPLYTAGLRTYDQWHAHMWLPSWV